MEDKIRDLVARWQKACERKQNWEPHWQECYNYAFPQRENVSISRQLDNYGSKQNLHLYDGTAPDAVPVVGTDAALGQMVRFAPRSRIKCGRTQPGSADIGKEYGYSAAKF